MFRFFIIFVLNYFGTLSATASNDSYLSAPLFTSPKLQNIPTVYQGRFRPLDSYAKLWLYDIYHHEEIKRADRAAFHSDNGSAQDLLWKIHFWGHAPWDEAPFFAIKNTDLKKRLRLDFNQEYFSYNQLLHVLDESQVDEFMKSAEAASLQHALRQYAQMIGSKMADDTVMEAALARLKAQGISSKEIAFQLETEFPLAARLAQADSLLKVLPGRRGEGEWFPLKALKAKVYHAKTGQLEFVGNFTAYSDEHFEKIHSLYFALESAVLDSEQDHASVVKEIRALSQKLASQLLSSYTTLAGQPYKEASGKSILYPSLYQLKAELFYYQYPLIVFTFIGYAFAAGLLILSLGGYRRSLQRLARLFGFGMLIAAFSFHSLLLILRCYILSRPPVSNMFETVIYVPWIAVVASFCLFWKLRNPLILAASSLIAIILLILLQLTNLSSGMENVQAVLDSQYWLIIHVLLIVGSYGAFALSGILAHFYLGCYAVYQRETASMQFVSQCMVQAIYLGVAMLIPGTILGGVWAAESWGRFWDWDPKESWAFISICIYLIWIHAYTFHHIRNFGLAVGAVIGLMAISFTWYGVNYVLGSGLHSYGFGSGGEYYYYLFLLGEVLFLAFVTRKKIGLPLNKEI